MFKAMLLEITAKKITNDDSNNNRDIIWVPIRKRMIKEVYYCIDLYDQYV